MLDHFKIEKITSYVPPKQISILLNRIEEEARDSIINKKSPHSMVLENYKGKNYRVANLNSIIRDGVITPIKNKILEKLDAEERMVNSPHLYMNIRGDVIIEIVKKGKKLEGELLESKTNDRIASVMLEEIDHIKKNQLNRSKNETYKAKNENGSFVVLNIDEFVAERVGIPLLELTKDYLMGKYTVISNSSYFHEKFKFFDVYDLRILPRTIIPDRFLESSIAIETNERMKKEKLKSKTLEVKLNEKLDELSERFADRLVPIIVNEIDVVRGGKRGPYLKKQFGKNFFNWASFLNSKLNSNFGLSEWVAGKFFPFPEKEFVLTNPIYSALIFKDDRSNDLANVGLEKDITDEIIECMKMLLCEIGNDTDMIFTSCRIGSAKISNASIYQEKFADDSILKMAEIDSSNFFGALENKLNDEIYRKLPYPKASLFDTDLKKEIYKINHFEVAWE
ncbi:MAG: hypothetical protein OH319_02650 [Candidatus Parvarchaeota archaeon]|nr:hypothetical protein [Candidatus Jingweiarchaeum tengchongense]MCW1298268.1 hypothetical protein [Candidatus Jingweiarchaeum tengchongense]MCW1300359.1 hypothetical protein [Candidatus Jingweiarchaeum tengchongense]MCW1304796.1 hypothetical protein [Candidatus Jingweiarchaeum tengchongense]MCW1305386.1 hypothetical protein [Candidatus Jingweiarchaeum tengchongense]